MRPLKEDLLRSKSNYWYVPGMYVCVSPEKSPISLKIAKMLAKMPIIGTYLFLRIPTLHMSIK